MMNAQAGSGATSYPEYLAAAIQYALDEEKSGGDDGNLEWMLERLRRGVAANWQQTGPTEFMYQYLFCVGSIQKPYKRRMAKADDGLCYWDRQLRLFRDADPARIVAEAGAIRREWSREKADLSPAMTEAFFATAKEIQVRGWDAFKSMYLLLPSNPASESWPDWEPARAALDELPMVGYAVSLYLLRNLYGGPFFKPDIHIDAIGERFFGGSLDALAEATKRSWKAACPAGSVRRLSAANLGVADYVLWYYRQAGEGAAPTVAEAAAAGGECRSPVPTFGAERQAGQAPRRSGRKPRA